MCLDRALRAAYDYLELLAARLKRTGSNPVTFTLPGAGAIDGLLESS